MLNFSICTGIQVKKRATLSVTSPQDVILYMIDNTESYDVRDQLSQRTVRL